MLVFSSMTIQILELVIKVTIEDERKKHTANNSSNLSGSVNQQELIYECVEQTLKRLEQLKER